MMMESIKAHFCSEEPKIHQMTSHSGCGRAERRDELTNRRAPRITPGPGESSQGTYAQK